MSTVTADQPQDQRVEQCSSSPNQSEQSNELRRRLTGDRETGGDAVYQQPQRGDTPVQQTKYKDNSDDDHRQTVRRRMRAQTYSNTKSVAQGFLNISLLSANAGQLKVVLQGGSDAMFYELLMTMIGLSMFLQLLVSYLLASKYMMEMDGYEDEAEQEAAMRHNRWATFLVTIISAVNVIISTFIGH